MKTWMKVGCGLIAVLALLFLAIVGYSMYTVMTNDAAMDQTMAAIEAEAKAPSTRKPQFGVEYVHRQTGDKWSFAQETNSEGVAIDAGTYQSYDDADRQVYEMRPSTGNRYDLYEEGASSSLYTVYVYEGADSILVSTTSRSRVFVANK